MKIVLLKLDDRRCLRCLGNTYNLNFLPLGPVKNGKERVKILPFPFLFNDSSALMKGF